MSENLKPCPCCGGPAVRSVDSQDNYVFCRYCGLRTRGYDTVAVAVVDWQFRVEDPLMDKLWDVVHAVCKGPDISAAINRYCSAALKMMAGGDDSGWLYLSDIAYALEDLEK